MPHARIYIGTSGFSYGHWRQSFYPQGTKAADYLAYYAQHFNTTEINSTFYTTPRQTTVENWVTKVPADFKFCVKMNRYITQLKKLNDPEEPLERFFTAIEAVKPLCGPVLIQLPASLPFNYDKTEHFFSLLRTTYTGYSYAIEPRHTSWFNDDSLSLMTKYEIAFVISQSNNKFPYAEFVTANNVYIRFHGPDALYASGYSDEMLAEYAGKMKQWASEGHTVWAYFNNDINAHAIVNAKTLLSLVNT